MWSRTEILVVVGLVVQLIIALITVLVAFLAARWGAQQGLAQAKQERLFERRIDWYERTIRTLGRFRLYCRTLRPEVQQLPTLAVTNPWGKAARSTITAMQGLQPIAEELTLCLTEGELHASPAAVLRMRALQRELDRVLGPQLADVEAIQQRRGILDNLPIWGVFRM